MVVVVAVTPTLPFHCSAPSVACQMAFTVGSNTRSVATDAIHDDALGVTNGRQWTLATKAALTAHAIVVTSSVWCAYSIGSTVCHERPFPTATLGFILGSRIGKPIGVAWHATVTAIQMSSSVVV